VQNVPKASNVTFVFAAKDGFTITDVRIDGLHLLSEQELALGQYTFYNVMANHTIEVRTIAGQGGGGGGSGGDDPGGGGGSGGDGSDDVTPGKDYTVLWLILLAVLVASGLILFFVYWIRAGLYLTIMMGETVKDAKVTYRVEKDGKTTNDIKLSNKKGVSRIPAKVGSTVIITMVAKDGAVAAGMPLTIVMEARKEYREIILN